MAARRWTIGAAALALVACSGGGADDPDAAAVPEPQVTAPLTFPSTTERQVAGPSSSTTTPAPPPTAPPVGLPDGLGIPGAGGLTLGGGSSLSNGITVRGVSIFEVVAFVERELLALGWAVQAAEPPAPGQVLFAFSGPGAIGQALLAPGVDGAIEVSLFLRGPG